MKVKLYLFVYSAVIVLAEATVAWVDYRWGFLLHLVVLLALVTHSSMRIPLQAATTLLALTLIPLLRIISFTMLTEHVPQIYWYALTGAPLLLSAAIIIRVCRIRVATLAVTQRTGTQQILIALSSLPLSASAYQIMKPQPLAQDHTLTSLVIACTLILVFTGFTEEIIFRGVIQKVMESSMGRLGILYSALLYTLVYFGSQNPLYIGFMFVVGLFFGWCVYRTNSLSGVVVAHGLMVFGALYIWPYYPR
jgi:uncharacterized protein